MRGDSKDAYLKTKPHCFFGLDGVDVHFRLKVTEFGIEMETIFVWNVSAVL